MLSGRSDRRDALLRGTVLREYTIESAVGHGGFGIVYRARHNEVGHIVAIKEYLPAELAARVGEAVAPRDLDCEDKYLEGLRRFRDEARALIKLPSHPNVVACQDFFRSNGTAYLVMEFVDGQPLSEVLRGREEKGRPFDEADLLAVAVPLAEGLDHVHQAGMLHRDINPSNIMIRRADGHPMLIDFGAAKQSLVEHTKSLAPYTDGYAALEQVADGELGPWTDLYGYGAVLWRMVAGGNRPWEPPNPVKVERRMSAKLRGDVDPLSSVEELGVGRFSAPVIELIERCLDLDITERIQDSITVLEMLRKDTRIAPNPDWKELKSTNSCDPQSEEPVQNIEEYESQLSSGKFTNLENRASDSGRTRDTTRLSGTLTIALLVYICMEALGIWLHSELYSASIGVRHQTLIIVGLLQDGSYLICVAVFMIWTYIMGQNARRLGDIDMRFTPGWAVGYYFVPVLCYWKPYQAMKEIFRAIRCHYSVNVRNVKRPIILPIWWVLWLFRQYFGSSITSRFLVHSLVVWIFSGSLNSVPFDVSSDINNIWALETIGGIFGIPAATACIIVVRVLQMSPQKRRTDLMHCS